MRIMRAFFQALWLTLRGKTYQPVAPVQPYPRLEAWRTVGAEMLTTVWQVADGHGLDTATRTAHKLKLDSRPISMETILRAVEHNLLREYPLLMATTMEHTMTTLYALNLNDRYRVRQLAASLTDLSVQTAVQRLADHLDAIPPSKAASV